eukprot:12202220-Alexandrium_andersonii.AAC.1
MPSRGSGGRRPGASEQPHARGSRRASRVDGKLRWPFAGAYHETRGAASEPVSYTHLRAHETSAHL